MAKNHLLWFVRGVVPKSHIMQCQAQLWITSRGWVDFMSYHPELPEVLHRVEPDEKLFKAFDEHIPVFCEELAAGRQRLIDEGVEPAGQMRTDSLEEEYV